MTMLQIHAKALDSVCTVYHEFLLRYRAKARTVYGVVEGKEDPMFYRGLIEHNLPEGWEVELIPAGCKDNVIKAITIFDWTRFSRKRVCFFTDRNLSEFISGTPVTVDNLYVTDNYSIENDAINFGTLKRLLEEVLNIRAIKSEEKAELKNRFEIGLSLFRDAMLPIMAQIIYWQRNGCRPCLNDIKYKDFFVFREGGIYLKSQFVTALSRIKYAAECAKTQPAPSTELANIELEFRQKQGIEKFIRGKYLLWFLVEFALELHRSISMIFISITSPPKIRINFGVANAMIVIAPRVRCPMSLQIFLDRTYGEYIRDTINDQENISAMVVAVHS